ncbi:MAG: glycosyltransferase [Flavobacteriaceae bacterium]|nr:glycosyltransferase [Flavobacteriaceae bacterium]
MKALLFIPKQYSLSEMILDGFNANGVEAQIIDYTDFFSPFIKRVYTKTHGFRKIAKYSEPAYYDFINTKYIEIINKEKPDIVYIYNNQFFFPDTLKKIKSKCKIVFFLGDHPLLSHTFDYNLDILQYSSYTISPDSHWKYELDSMGIPNVVCDQVGSSNKLFFQTSNISKEIKNKYESDLLFVGRNYSDSSGYKRTLFFNSFKDNDLKIFGNENWYKWFNFFPELEKNFILRNNRISHEELNLAINCTKVLPIDQNPGLINGIHLRVFEAIGAGTLPIMEWRKDIDLVFQGLLPVIKKYEEAQETVQLYLDDESLRIETINKLRQFVNNNYTPELLVKRLITFLIK